VNAYKDYSWRVEFLIDPGGVYEGKEVIEQAFVLEE